MRSSVPDHHAAPVSAASAAAMLSPSTGRPMHLVETEPAGYTLRGLSFTLSSPTWECPDTQQRYSSPEQVDIFLARVHHAWRQHHGIGCAALRERRQALGLSAAQTSALLGFGVNQYRTYEQTDKLPSKSNAVLLRLLMTEPGIAGLLAAAGNALTPAARRKVQQHVLSALPAAPPLRTPITSNFDWAGGPAGRVIEQLPPSQQPPQLPTSNQARPSQQQSATPTDALVADAGKYSYAMAA